MTEIQPGKFTYLHCQIRIAHAPIDSQLRESMSTVLFHGIQNGLGLETSSLQRRTGNVALLGVRSDTKDGPPRIVIPVRGVQAREGRDEDNATIVRH